MGSNLSTLPTTWTTATLGAIAHGFLSGGTPSTKNETFWQGDVPWITSKWLNSRLYLNNGEKFISEDAVKKSATTVVPRNNLIFATRVGVGKAAVNRLDLAINQDLAGILIDSERYDVSFLAYQLRCSRIQDEVTSHKRGATIQGITRDNLKSLEIFLPPLPEQRKIAAVLGMVQRAIDQQERLIALTTELKKTLLHQLFTQGLCGEPQKETEIGLVPESWEVVELGQISHKPEYGFTESAKASGNAQFLRITDIQKDGVQWGSVPFCDCPDELMERYLLTDNDILFARIGATTGKNFLVKQPPRAIFASYLIRVRLKNATSADFISQFCDTSAYWRQIEINKGNNLKGGINSSTLKKLLVPVTSDRKEQDVIAEILQQVDTKVSYARRKREALTALFRTMLHQLMTAQIRVNDISIVERELVL